MRPSNHISCTLLFWCTHPIHVVYILILIHPSNPCRVQSDTPIQSSCTFLFWGSLLFQSNPSRVNSYSDASNPYSVFWILISPSNPSRVHSYSDPIHLVYILILMRPSNVVYILILMRPSNPSRVHSHSGTPIQSISCTFLLWYPIHLVYILDAPIQSISCVVYILILIHPSNPSCLHSYSDAHPIHLVYILILMHPSNPSNLICAHSIHVVYIPIQSISFTWYVLPIFLPYL